MIDLLGLGSGLITERIWISSLAVNAHAYNISRRAQALMPSTETTRRLPEKKKLLLARRVECSRFDFDDANRKRLRRKRKPLGRWIDSRSDSLKTIATSLK